MTRLSEIEPRVTRYVWEERIPANMLSAIGGRPGGGKSLLIAHIGARVSHHADVILSHPENRRHESVRPRVEAAGANLDRVHYCHDLRFPRDLEALEAHIVRHRARLVALDPLAGHIDFEARRRISRFDDSIRLVCEPLDRIAERNDCAIIVTEHILKNVQPRAHLLQAIGGGSSGLTAAAQMVYVVGRDPTNDERVVLCSAKSNVRDDPPPYAFRRDNVSFTGADGRTGPVGLLTPLGETQFPDPISMLLRPREEKPGPAPEKLAEASEWLSNYLFAAAGYERPAKEAEEDARAHGITKGTLTRAKTVLKIESTQRKREWWWTLPQELVDSLDGEEGDDAG